MLSGIRCIREFRFCELLVGVFRTRGGMFGFIKFAYFVSFSFRPSLCIVEISDYRGLEFCGYRVVLLGSEWRLGEGVFVAFCFVSSLACSGFCYKKLRVMVSVMCEALGRREGLKGSQ